MRRIAYGIALVALLLVFGSMWLQHSRLPTVQELQGAAQLLTSDRLSMERYAADGTHVATVTAHQVTQGVSDVELTEVDVVFHEASTAVRQIIAPRAAIRQAEDTLIFPDTFEVIGEEFTILSSNGVYSTKLGTLETAHPFTLSGDSVVLQGENLSISREPFELLSRGGVRVEWSQ